MKACKLIICLAYGSIDLAYFVIGLKTKLYAITFFI